MIGAAFGLFIVGLGFCLYKKKQKRFPRIHRPKTVSKKSQDAMTSDIQLLGVGKFVFSIKVLRETTNNFREQNILGRVRNCLQRGISRRDKDSSQKDGSRNSERATLETIQV